MKIAKKMNISDIPIRDRLIDFGAFLELEILIGRRPKDISKFVDGYLASLNLTTLKKLKRVGKSFNLIKIEH